jgi:hypothetical protein
MRAAEEQLEIGSDTWWIGVAVYGHRQAVQTAPAHTLEPRETASLAKVR